MADRRDFLKVGLGVVAGAAGGVAVAQTVLKPNAESGAMPSNAPKAASGGLPSNIVYTADDPGQWAKKVGGHLPNVTVEGKTVTITTEHVMKPNHYIVRHTLVAEDGTVIGGKVFQPGDDPLSTYELPEGHGSKFYATSFCNKHDLWLAEFTV
jgi:superoxide reductase